MVKKQDCEWIVVTTLGLCVKEARRIQSNWEKMKLTIGCFGHSRSAKGPKLRRKEEANSSEDERKAKTNTENEQEVM